MSVQREKEPREDAQPPRFAMSHTDRAVAAIVGAVTTSLLMTPLDVVKTRLQTQITLANVVEGAAQNGNGPVGLTQPSPYRACPIHGNISHGTHPLRPRSFMMPRTTPMYTVSTAIPLRLAENSQAMCLYPGKCSVSACEAENLLRGRNMNGIIDGIFKVAHTEGWRGLWRGLVPTIAMTVPSQVMYMSCYDALRTLLLSLETTVQVRTPEAKMAEEELNDKIVTLMDGDPYFSCVEPSHSDAELQEGEKELLNYKFPLMGASLISGALARATSATLVTPLELLRTRLQATEGSTLVVLEPLYKEMQRKGFGVLWRGLSATLWRDVPFSAIYFSGYEGGRYLLTGGGFGEGRTSSFWHEFGISFGLGATSGSVAAFATHPFDLVKTRLQADANINPRKSANFTSTGSIFSVLQRIVQYEGMPALFRGLSPRLAKVAPSCGIMIGSYEVVGRYLAGSHA